MTVMMGATSAPAHAAAPISEPTLQGKFAVFHCVSGLMRGGDFARGTEKFVGNDRGKEGLVSSAGGEQADVSSLDLSRPASRVI